MLTKAELQSLHTNQRLLVAELQSRGIDITLLFSDIELLEAEYKRHRELILDRDSSINPYASSILSGDKYITKMLLQKAGISVTKGRRFFPEEVEAALQYANNAGYPVVVKPVFGSHGEGVHLGLKNPCRVKEAIENVFLLHNSGALIVEEQFDGKEYRVFVTKKGNYAVLHRDPAHIMGNGKQTIAQLAKKESFKRMNPRKNSLCPILIDKTAKEYLRQQGKNLQFIPKKGEKVYLRRNSNVAAGGVCEDYTDKVHPSVIEISKKALSAFHGMPYAGIDFMSRDITAEQVPDMYRILEVNSIPGIHMHMRPGSGKPRNVAKYIADIIFPETKRI